MFGSQQRFSIEQFCGLQEVVVYFEPPVRKCVRIVHGLQYIFEIDFYSTEIYTSVLLDFSSYAAVERWCNFLETSRAFLKSIFILMSVKFSDHYSLQFISFAKAPCDNICLSRSTVFP